MLLRRLFNGLALIVLAISCIASSHPSFGANLSHSLYKPTLLDQPGERDKLSASLESKDKARFDAAVSEIRSVVLQKGYHQTSDLDMIAQAGRPDLAESICISAIRINAANTTILTQYVNERVRILQAAGDKKAALSAAKQYYNICPLKLNSHAVNLLSECLLAAHPDDQALLDRFQRQQLAWAFASATTKPATTNPAQPGLGISVLSTIPMDVAPFLKMVKSLPERTYSEKVAKGNILILGGRPDEARAMFEGAADTTTWERRTKALQGDVARAIRAKCGCIGPAESYLKKQADAPGL